MYPFSLVHAPLPWSSAYRGFSSPLLGRHRRPWLHVPVYTPHAAPSARAHVRQQPQPGSLTSWQPPSTGGHMDNAFWSHGSHGTYEPQQPDSDKTSVSRRQNPRNIVGAALLLLVLLVLVLLQFGI